MSLFKRKDSKFYWIRYSYRGKHYRESTGETDPKKAEKYFANRRDQIGADRLGVRKFVPPASDKITVSELLDSLLTTFRVREIKGLKPAESHIARARGAFGHYLAREITPALVDHWLEQAKAAGAVEPSTLNRAVSMLGQALRLAAERNLIASAPRLRKLSEVGRERRGFFEQWEVDSLVTYLPSYLRGFCRFAYLTGWRKGEIASLTWEDVDLQGRMIRLRAEHSKNKAGRALFLEGQLWEIIQQAGAVRPIEQGGKVELSSYVFHNHGVKIGDFRKAWAIGCIKAGIGPKHFHDFRRTAARNLRRAGVSETVCMAITGHKTRSIFDRYNIVSEQDLREAQAAVQAHLQGQPKQSKIQPMRKAEDGK